MASQQNLLAVALGVLAFSSFLDSAKGKPGEEERIADSSIIKNLNDKANCVAFIALQVAVPPTCSPTGQFFVQECTAAVIGRKTLISNANCVTNMLALQTLCFTRFNFVCPAPYPALILGSQSTSPDGVAAAGVLTINLLESMLEYHPDFNNGSSHDIVAIKLDTEIPTSICPQPFLVPSQIQNELTYAGPFMISWGEPACTGLTLTNETYSLAKRTSACSDAVDGISEMDDQICMSLKRVQDNTVKPKAAQGDPGAPIYVAVSSGENGSMPKYILSALLGLFPKSDPVLFPDEYGAGCSKTSVVPAVNLLDSSNMAFLADLAAQQGDIMTSPIPELISV